MGKSKSKSRAVVRDETSRKEASGRPRYLFAVVALLSLIGLADAIYLTVKHVTGGVVPCTLTGSCEQVLNSSYATIAGIPLAAFGALAYFTVFSLAILAAFGNER